MSVIRPKRDHTKDRHQDGTVRPHHFIQFWKKRGYLAHENIINMIFLFEIYFFRFTK